MCIACFNPIINTDNLQCGRIQHVKKIYGTYINITAPELSTVDESHCEAITFSYCPKLKYIRSTAKLIYFQMDEYDARRECQLPTIYAPASDVVIYNCITRLHSANVKSVEIYNSHIHIDMPFQKIKLVESRVGTIAGVKHLILDSVDIDINMVDMQELETLEIMNCKNIYIDGAFAPKLKKVDISNCTNVIYEPAISLDCLRIF